MALLLRDTHVQELHNRAIVKMGDYKNAIREAYHQHGLGQAQSIPRENLWVQKKSRNIEPSNTIGHDVPEKPAGSLKVLACSLPELDTMGVVSYAAGFGRSPEMWHLLYSTREGRLTGVIQAHDVAWMKTGAVGALAAELLALRKETYRIGIFGSGRQAWTQVLGLASTVKIESIKVHSRTEAHRNAFAERIRKEMRLPVIPVATPEETVRDEDIVVTITTAKEPVLSGEWLKPGMHVNAIGAHYPDIREVDDETVRRSRIIVDIMAQALVEKGDLLIPLARGVINKDDLRAELGEVVCGSKPGRLSDSEITLFCSGGTAIEHIAAAHMVLEKARQNGFGVSIPD